MFEPKIKLLGKPHCSTNEQTKPCDFSLQSFKDRLDSSEGSYGLFSEPRQWFVMSLYWYIESRIWFGEPIRSFQDPSDSIREPLREFRIVRGILHILWIGWVIYSCFAGSGMWNTTYRLKDHMLKKNLVYDIDRHPYTRTNRMLQATQVAYNNRWNEFFE